jgi:hypothetical protein
MKLSTTLALVISVSGSRLSNRVRRANEDRVGEDDDRRYFQLTDMMEHYNADFDERKYWAYGCNCLILGDRPMSDPGHGPPVDALDTVCKAYKDCVKCARMEFGEMCIGEFVKYKYGYKNGEAVCRDDAGTCGRALCECDAKFAREHVGSTHVFDNKYHMFWSTSNGYPMWDPKNNPADCPTGGGGAYLPQCCQNKAKTTPFLLYNAEAKKCCNDGKVVKNREEC